jgi:hypothetical protein
MGNSSRILTTCTFDRLVLCLVSAAITLAVALSPMQSDTWWHLRTGADILQSQRVSLVDTYSHTAFGMPWPNHEWLSQVIFYLAYAFGGPPLVSLAAAGLIVGAWALVWHLCIGDSMRRLMIVGPLLIPASLQWSARPQAFSLLFLAIALVVVISGRIWWLPLLFFIWANCHGAVVLGFLVTAAAFAVMSLDDRRQWRRYALVLIVCGAVTTLTPLGIGFWSEIPKSLDRIRQYPIEEWRAPTLMELPLAPFWIVAASICIGVVVRWRTLLSPENRQTRILCASALAVLPLAATAIRNVSPFVMVAAPALCGLLNLAPLGGANIVQARRTRVEHLRFNAAAMVVATLLVVVTIGSAYHWQVRHLRWTPLPNASLEALQQCPEHLYNRYDEGGYLIWFAPAHRVFLDNRQDPYPPALIKDQLRIEESGDYGRTFERYHIHCAYLPTTSRVAAGLLSAGWSTLFRDGQWLVLADSRTSLIKTSLDMWTRNLSVESDSPKH